MRALGVNHERAFRLTADREIQLFLAGYIVVEICEIFSIGGFPLNNKARIVRLGERRDMDWR